MNDARDGLAPVGEAGIVARRSAGGWSEYHRPECPLAPHRGDPGVRGVVRGPWRYLAAHWAPCPDCRPPVEALREAA
ncbi:MAG: hypothetical protein AB7V42_07615 [Thermoleophilia bacterium]